VSIEIDRGYDKDYEAVGKYAVQKKAYEVAFLKTIKPNDCILTPTDTYAKFDGLFSRKEKSLRVEYEETEKTSPYSIRDFKIAFPNFHVLGRKEPKNWDVYLKRFRFRDGSMFVWLNSVMVDWQAVPFRMHNRDTLVPEGSDPIRTSRAYRPLPWSDLENEIIGFLTFGVNGLDRLSEEISRSLSE